MNRDITEALEILSEMNYDELEEVLAVLRGMRKEGEVSEKEAQCF